MNHETLHERMNWDSPAVLNLIRRVIEEDLGPGDVTSLATVPAAAVARARIIARAPLVCAGLPIAERVFRELDSGMETELLAKDGDTVEKRRDLARAADVPGRFFRANEQR